ncbi:hypothetical protein TNCV_4048881 [Trichonephila clavipes]|nr:hypothetical protein TNCV_4048881 [Trichonephila clavipes]
MKYRGRVEETCTYANFPLISEYLLGSTDHCAPESVVHYEMSVAMMENLIPLLVFPSVDIACMPDSIQSVLQSLVCQCWLRYDLQGCNFEHFLLTIPCRCISDIEFAALFVE